MQHSVERYKVTVSGLRDLDWMQWFRKILLFKMYLNANQWISFEKEVLTITDSLKGFLQQHTAVV